MSETKEPVNPETTDPVATNAARIAIEQTDKPKPKYPWLNGLMITIIAVIILFGTAGAVLGTINTFQVQKNNHELATQNDKIARQQKVVRQQQICVTSVLQALTEEQNARVHIAADDRTALQILVSEIASATTPEQVDAALDEFQHRSHVNDLRRAKFPTPTFDTNVCHIVNKGDPGAKHTHMPSTSPTPTKHTKSSHPKKGN